MNKTCIKCGKTKPVAEYYKNSTYLDGYSSTCKGCKLDYQRRYFEDNKAAVRGKAKQYYHDNKLARAKYGKQWRADNAAYKAECDREWKRNNPERVRAQRKIENARRRARLESADGDYTVVEWLNLKKHYGGMCLKCGKIEPEVKITPDHVIPLALGGRNAIDNIQPLCWGCNAAKQARIVDYRDNYKLPAIA